MRSESAGDIAIVGMSCRLPGGVHSPEELWSLLVAEGDAIGEIGDDRWSKDLLYNPRPEEPGKSYTWRAGTVDGLRAFDSEFFRVSPREAGQLDPQQRLLLELAVEALEDGGQTRRAVAGTRSSVFVGISAMDFASLRWPDPSSGNAYAVLGKALSIAANRISYFLDLKGPSVSVDTACSSSMVALHLACQGLRTGETELAIVGGVNVLLAPFPFVGFCRATMLSPSGVCAAFDADGEGYVRSEGGVVLVLKSLAQAQQDGDRIHAVIRASGTNADGRTTGLSMPSPVSQRALLETIYGERGIDPEDLVYVEAHGTGTAVGDPVEAQAIGEALGQRRNRERPLLIGSVKTNVGHLEPASGLTGIVKSALILKHRLIPPSIHFHKPNPNIDFERLNIKVAATPTPLSASRRPAVIGVNSFGFGGTNAHAVVAEPERSPQQPRRSRTAPLLLSAHRAEAVGDLADQYRTWLAGQPDTAFADIAYTRAARRDHLEHRLAVAAAPRAEIVDRLDAFRAGEDVRGVVTGRAAEGTGRLAVVFSGNGSQWFGMGRDLLAGHKGFRATLRKIDRLFAPLSGWSLLQEMECGNESRFDDTEISQPLLFGLQIAAWEAMRAEGLVVHAVTGHSVGEVAAACAAGALSLRDAVRVIDERSRAQSASKGTGKMAVVGAPLANVFADLEQLGRPVEIAGINSPNNIVVSGAAEAIEEVRTHYESRGVYVRVLGLEYPFHSAAMDGLRDGLIDALQGIRPRRPRLELVSTVTADRVAGRELDSGYWWRNVRQPVRFADSVRVLQSFGCTAFLEVGPQPILQAAMRETLSDGRPAASVLWTLAKHRADGLRLQETVLEAYCAGCTLDTDVVFPSGGRCVGLPAYPWQREPCWFPTTPENTSPFTRERTHPLLGYVVLRVDNVWENDIDLDVFTEFLDHAVLGSVVFPASAFAEIGLAAAKAVFGDAPGVEIAELEIRRPLALERGTSRVLRTRVDDDRTLVIESRDRMADQEFTLHAIGRVRAAPRAARPLRESLQALWPDGDGAITATEHYRRTELLGLAYGEAFRRVSAVRVESDCAVALLTTRTNGARDADAYHLDPACLDAGFQALANLLFEVRADATSAATTYVPSSIGRLSLEQTGTTAAFARARLERVSARSVVAAVELFDADGVRTAFLEGCRFYRIPGGRSDPIASIYRFVPVAIANGDDADGPAVEPAHLAEVARTAMQGLRDTEQPPGRSKEAALFLDAIAAAFVSRALRALGADSEPFTPSRLAETAGVAPSSLPLFHRLCEMLAEDGELEGCEEGLRMSPIPSLPDPEHIWRGFVSEYPEYLAEATLLGRAGMRLPERLTLNGDAPDFLLSDEAKTTLDHLTMDAPSYAAVNTVLVHMIREIAARWPGDRPLRVIEIGAGTGRISRRTFEELRDIRCEYVFTDADESALARARQELAGFPFVRFECLDISSDDALSQFDAPAFDVAIAANVLHLGEDVTSMLRRTRRLLHRHGLLLVAQRRADRFSDMVFGSDPAWWRPDPSGRSPASRLVSTRQWQVMLGGAGFTAPPLVVGGDEDPGGTDAFVVITANPTADSQAAETQDEEPAPAAGAVLVLSDPDGPGAGLAAAVVRGLRGGGREAISAACGGSFEYIDADRFQFSPQTPAHWERLWETLQGANTAVSAVVDVTGLAADADDPLLIPLDRCETASYLLRSLATAQSNLRPAVHWVTLNAMVADDDLPGCVPQSALWGFGRVAVNEYPQLRLRMIDLQSQDALETCADRLVDELLRDSDEDEILLADSGRHVLRAEAIDAAGEPRVRISAQQAGGQQRSFRLEAAQPGAFERLQWSECPRRSPGPGEVQIRVRAAGLNFRDIMWAMGLLPDDAVEDGYAGPSLGIECAGEVVAVGEGVTTPAVGEAVMAFASLCFSDHVITDAATVVRKPDGLSFAEAATIPTAFFTAFYALSHLARLREGERVLIHGGAGGVGLAALQYAKSCGATVFATAGSDEKRDFLRLLGADHVLNSRSLAFADEVLELTGGEGVDVVLNCLAGEAMVRSLELLRPFGRFLELGKRDFAVNSRIGLRPLRRNITYFAIDADQILVNQRALALELLSTVMRLFQDGTFRPLALRVFDAEDIAEAFRHMQQSRHIGKVVLNLERGPRDVVAIHDDRPALTLDGRHSYLVTGGLSGFGLATARWLAAKGARHLVLVGRSGASTDAARTAVEDLRADGIDVRVESCDVADAGQVEDLFDRLRAAPPLDGIIHAAMVLDDALIADLNRERFGVVFRPKIQGAWNLDRISRSLPLRFFILFSSATTLVGNPGQANYVAANLVLERLARERRRQGLPAHAVAWGPIADAGYLAENAAVRELLARRLGGRLLTADRALDTLERLLVNDVWEATVVDLDWRAVRAGLPGAAAPKFGDVLRGVPDLPSGIEGTESLRAQLAEKSPEEVTAVLRALIAEQVANVLRLPLDRLDTSRSLVDCGMDSLMALELGLALEKEVGIDMPPLSLGDRTSIDTLAALLAGRIAGAPQVGAASDPEASVVSILFDQHVAPGDEADMEELAETLDIGDARGTRLVR